MSTNDETLPGRARLSLLVFLTALLLCVLASRRASAAMMTHHDLSSLALESEVIVLARIVGVRQGEWSEIRNHEVLEVYAGAGLTPGDQLELDYGALRMTSSWSDPSEDTQADDEVVLFLVHDYRGNWFLLGSGLRIFVDGLTYRFEQAGNPGPYEPVVQGHDPYDVLGDPRGGQGLERAQFEVELHAAIERAEAVREALTHVDSGEGRARLLELLGPKWGLDDDEPCSLDRFSFYDDLTRKRILEALTATGDLETTLEGVSRVCGELFYPRLPIGTRRLLEYAGEAERPIHHRLAALRLLRDDVGELRADALIPLLKDPDPRIRAAAVMPLQDEDASERWRAAIVERLRVETDDRARYELLVVAQQSHLLDAPDLPQLHDPIVTTVRRGRSFEVRWTSLGEPWQLERLSIELDPEHGEARTLELDVRKLGWWSSGGSQAATGWLLVDEAFPDKPIRIEVVAVLTQDSRVHEAHVSMRPIGLVPDPAITEAASEPEPTPVPSGCACASEEPRGRGGLVLLALALLSLTASRSARRCLAR